MAFYQDMQNIATELLDDFKQGLIEYGRITPGSGPADDPGPSVITWSTVKAVARGVSFKYAQLSMVVETDLQITMAADQLTPDMRDMVRIDGGTAMKIVHIVAKPSAGIPAAFILIVRK